jgi:transposase
VDRVFVAVDPHKKSVTFETRDSREVLRATGCFPTDAGGYRLLVQYARQSPFSRQRQHYVVVASQIPARER